MTYTKRNSNDQFAEVISQTPASCDYFTNNDYHIQENKDTFRSKVTQRLLAVALFSIDDQRRI